MFRDYRESNLLHVHTYKCTLYLFAVLLRVWREVPGVNLIAPDLNAVNVLDLSEGLVLLFQGSRSGVHLRIALQCGVREGVR